MVPKWLAGEWREVEAAAVREAVKAAIGGQLRGRFCSHGEGWRRGGEGASAWALTQ